MRGSYISAVYTHIQIHAYLCTDQPLKPKCHFFCCAANKEIWHLEAIRRAVIFDVDFVINDDQEGHSVNLYVGNIHTFTYMHICAQISYKRHFLRIRKWHLREAIRRAALDNWKIFTVDKYYRDTVRTATVTVTMSESVKKSLTVNSCSLLS